MSGDSKELANDLQQQVFRYEYVLEALSDIGDELCRVSSFDSQLKSLLHLLLGTLGIRRGGIFIFDNIEKKIRLKCAWKLSHKRLEADIDSAELNKLESISGKSTFKIDEFEYLSDLLDNFKEDELDSVSVLRVREKLIGLLVVGGKLKNVSLNDKEMNFLETLSHNISVAINNFLLLSELRETNMRLDEKIQEVSILYQASQMISSEIQLQALLDMAMSAISEITDIEQGSTWLYEPETHCFSLMSHHGEVWQLPDVINSADSDVFSSAVEQRESFSVIDGNVTWGELSERDKELFGDCFVVVPIVHKGDFLGLLNLSAKGREAEFSERDMRLIRVFTIQLGAAVKNAQLYEQAITDGLTKLYLHRYFKQRLFDEHKRAARFKRNLALIMIDIDHFKSLNDNYGHQAGDEVLKEVAVILRRAVRTHDLPVRCGGEEFALVLPETDMQGAVAVAERVRRSIETAKIEVGNSLVLSITASLGVSVFPDSAACVESIIKAADVALYWSKEHGRNQVTAAPSILSRNS